MVEEGGRWKGTSGMESEGSLVLQGKWRWEGLLGLFSLRGKATARGEAQPREG